MAQGIMTVSDDEIIRLLREQAEPAYTTGEVADMVDMSKEGVRNRLNALVGDDRLCKKKPNPQCTMWWLPEISCQKSPLHNIRTPEE